MEVVLITSFVLSFLFCAVILYFFEHHKHLSGDNFEGPQKYHDQPTPRIGGLAIFSAVFIVSLYLVYLKKSWQYLFFILSSLPVFAFGFLEDLTKRISPKLRLIAAIIAGIFAYIFLDSCLNRLDLSWLDFFLQYKFISIAFTLFAIAGVTNSINIIDGYNGLAAVVSMMIFLALAYVGFKVRDVFVFTVSFVMIGSIGGFFIWNYPFGRIFLGDGGAYFIGFIIAILSVLLVKNHPQVSPWFPLLIVIYPVFETLFSIYRRKFCKKCRVDMPDSHHLHQLVYKRIVPQVFKIDRDEKLMRNSATSPFLWLLCSLGVIPGILFWNRIYVLIGFVVFFCVFYVWVYKRIVTFKFFGKKNSLK